MFAPTVRPRFWLLGALALALSALMGTTLLAGSGAAPAAALAPRDAPRDAPLSPQSWGAGGAGAGGAAECTPGTPPARTGHTLTGVGDDLYLFGGWVKTTALIATANAPLEMPDNDLWKYDGVQNDWCHVPCNNPPAARFLHSAAASGGKLFVFFGVDSFYDIYFDINLYDPGTNTWTQQPSTGDVPPPRAMAAAVGLGDYIYLYGGLDKYGLPADGYLWRYTPGAGVWQRGPKLTPTRYNHTLVVVNGRLVVRGGETGGEVPNDLWAYDPAAFPAGAWYAVTLTGAMPTKTTEQAGAAYLSKLWIYGGTTAGCLAASSAALRPRVGGEIDEVWEFEFNSEATTAVARQLASLPAARTQAAAAALAAAGAQAAGVSADGHPRVLLFGGKDVAGNRVADTLLYSTGTYTWNGGTSADWSAAANWTPAGVPLYGNDVVIPAGSPAHWPTLDAGPTIHDLTIGSAAALTITQGVTLTATGVVTNAGRLTQIRAADAPGAGVAFGLWGNAGALAYAGLTITPTVTGLGTVTVSVAGDVCGTAGTLPQAVKRCFTITPQTAGPATVRFFYHASEANGNTDPTVYHWTGSAWQALATTARNNTGAGWRWVEAQVDSYSPFALKDGTPTAVVLRRLAAQAAAPVGLVIGLASVAVGWVWAARRRPRKVG